ncbi:MAG: hypothetical protein ACTS5F_01725, partial [Candidatus Hodgkinia cicadicola]
MRLITSKPETGSSTIQKGLAGDAAIAATQPSQTWEGIGSNGLTIVAAAGIAFERKALIANAIGSL